MMLFRLLSMKKRLSRDATAKGELKECLSRLVAALLKGHHLATNEVSACHIASPCV